MVHGDFRLGNLMAVGAHINAVIDWEIWSIGDPRIDAGWFLINCDPDTYRRVPASAGIAPPIAELTEIYQEELGREVADLAWFTALACFKSAATWSLIVKHNRRRRSPRAELEAMAATLPRLLAARPVNGGLAAGMLCVHRHRTKIFSQYIPTPSQSVDRPPSSAGSTNSVRSLRQYLVDDPGPPAQRGLDPPRATPVPPARAMTLIAPVSSPRASTVKFHRSLSVVAANHRISVRQR